MPIIYRENQDRLIFDDRDIVDDLFVRIQNSLPSQIERFTLSRLNERFRCYRYRSGQKFEPHMDHWYQANEIEISLLSVLVYFNNDFVGGETRFMEQLDAVVKPEIGKVVIFQR